MESAIDAINLYYGCNKDTLRVKETINGIVKAIQFHAAIAGALGSPYAPHFGRVFQGMNYYHYYDYYYCDYYYIYLVFIYCFIHLYIYAHYF